jgi:hypothetical protein
MVEHFAVQELAGLDDLTGDQDILGRGIGVQAGVAYQVSRF